MEKSEKGKELHPLIADGQAFELIKQAGRGWRNHLYAKVNKHLAPAKNHRTIFNWFSYPVDYLPKQSNTDFLQHVMLAALAETANDILDEFRAQKEFIDQVIPELEKTVNSYEQETGEPVQ